MLTQPVTVDCRESHAGHVDQSLAIPLRSNVIEIPRSWIFGMADKIRDSIALQPLELDLKLARVPLKLDSPRQHRAALTSGSDRCPTSV